MRKYLHKRVLPAIIAMLCCCSVNITKAQVTVTATGGTATATYPYLSAAFAAINNGTHQDSIVVEISSSITDTAISILNSSGDSIVAGAAFYRYVWVRPSVDGITLSYASPQGRGVIELNGADTVVIDGDNPNTPGINRNLTIINTAANTVNFTSVIRVASSATAPYSSANNITVKNLILNGSATGRNISSATSTSNSENTTFGVVVGPNGGPVVTALTSVTTTTAGTARINEFITDNCVITACAQGICFLGGANAVSSSVTLSNNIIGDTVTLSGSYPYTTPATTVYANGIYVRGTNSVVISNNIIKNIVSYLAAVNGVQLAGSIGNGSVQVVNNTIDGVISNNSSSGRVNGVWVSGGTGGLYTIGSNIITNIQNSGSSNNQPSGFFTNVSGSAIKPVIESNRISKIYNYNQGTNGANGIFLQSGRNDTIRNNFIWDINQDISATNTTFGINNAVIGIRISNASQTEQGHCIYNNTVHLSGSHLGTLTSNNKTSFAFSLANTNQSNCDIRNNIFSNTMTGGGSNSVHASIFLPSGLTPDKNIILNNNLYYSGTDSATQAIAQVGTTAGTGAYLAADFNTASILPASNLRAYTFALNTNGDNDVFSSAFDVLPPFISNTDLHITPGIQTPVESGAAVIAGVTTDIDSEVRPGPVSPVYGGSTAPDIGADEGDFIPDSVVITSITGTQFTDETAPSIINQRIHRIAIQASGSINRPALSSLKLNTTGTTNPFDISAAKVYYTANDSLFNTNSLFGTAASPIGTFYISGAQTIYPGMNYFWVTYDLTNFAGISNQLDVTIDSLVIGGVNYESTDKDPIGAVVVTTPMSYVDAAVFHPDTSTVGRGTSDNEILGIRVITSSTGTPVQLTNLTVSTLGTTALANITALRIWYTGADSNFAAANLFGSKTASLTDTQTITGAQVLLNDTNYFWITYDLAAGATLGNVIDAACISLTIGGLPQTLSDTSALGNRKIRNAYCAAAHGAGTGYCISNVSINTLNYTSACSGGYNDYSNIGDSATTTLQRSVTYNLSVTRGNAGQGNNTFVWIDWNNDGLFSTNEFTTVGTGTGATVSVPITVPCDAALGKTRIRIRTSLNTNNITGSSSCTSFTNAESEDYTITIADSVSGYVFSTAIQQTGVVAPNTTDREILRIPIKMHGCGTSILTKLDFNTTGTTNSANITNAKLYSTGNSAIFDFTKLKLVGTVSLPNGLFSFTINDTLLNNDTTNYWLTYEISGAAQGFTFDAVLHQIEIDGIPHSPDVADPAGNILVTAAMTYISSTTTQIDTATKVVAGSSNNPIIGIKVITSPTGAPIYVTQLDFNATGTTNLSNIINIKVFYTGNTDTFNTAKQFGGTVAFVGNSFSVTGTIPLTNDTNHFWLTYDIVGGSSAVNNFVDAECTGITVDNILNIPSITAPSGKRQIRADYCITQASNTSPCTLGSFNDIQSVVTTGGSTNINNPTSGCTSPYYNYYPSQVLTIKQNETFTITLANLGVGSTSLAKVWIDYNQDGLFDNEEISLVKTGSDWSAQITVPCSASLGLTRMRVRNSANSATLTSCFTLTSFAAGGETEDYLVNILPGDSLSYQAVTAIQQTAIATPGSFNVPVLRIPVKTTGCYGVITATDFRFNTTGTTLTSDISMAKLYRTGNSPVFNTSKLLDSVYYPFGSFAFTVTDTLLNNDTTNYWLTYDVVSWADPANVLDAVFDSVNIGGTYRIPTVNNPAGSVSLPVKLLHFGGSLVENDVILTWITASEKNNKGFEVQRLTNKGWENIGFVEGKGNSFANSSYQFIDPSPFVTERELFYRLKQIDFDGVVNYSQTIVVTNNKQNLSTVSVFPNPIKDQYTVSLYSKVATSISVKMHDVQGRLVAEHNVDVVEGMNAVQIRDLNIQSGVYFLNISVGEENYAFKVVK